MRLALCDFLGESVSKKKFPIQFNYFSAISKVVNKSQSLPKKEA